MARSAAAIAGRRHEADVQGGLHPDRGRLAGLHARPVRGGDPADHRVRRDPDRRRVRVPFTDIATPLQVTDLPVSVLFIVAIASIGVYGIVLAGWSSGSTYALLGALRSSAQVISYEVAMGLALVAVFLYAGSLSTSEIVAKQAESTGARPVPLWYAVQLFPSFVIYLISMVGETNRAPVRPARGRG